MKKEKPGIGLIILVGAAIILLFGCLEISQVINFSPFSMTGFITFESQPDSSSGKDTYVRQNVETNYGSASILRFGKNSGGTEFYSFLEFNLSSITDSYTITEGVLQVYLTLSSDSNSTLVKLYRVTSPWTASEVTWNNNTASSLWISAGGDYSEEFASTTFTDTLGYYDFTITSLVQGWINGSYSNYGLILITDGAENGEYKEIASAEYETSGYRPKLTIEYTENAAPSISDISVLSTLSNPKAIGDNETFTISWSDLENNAVSIYICNSSTINLSGCADKTFCNTSLASTNPAVCSYTITPSENRTSVFYVSACDAANCSIPNQSQFYINHNPNITIIQPNGGETINQSQGNYLIKFNIFDSDNDYLFANIYLTENGTTTLTAIAENLNLTSSNYCYDSDLDTSTQNACNYSWNSSGVYGTYNITIRLNDSYSISDDFSNSLFYVRSVTDSAPPNIYAQWIESGIYCGKTIKIYANASDPNMKRVWVSLNTTPQTNLTMLNSTQGTYNVSWTAAYSVGPYKFKVYAEDSPGNLNDSINWQEFNITKPNASTQSQVSPSNALQYAIIKITAELNATDELRDVYAFLNIPSGFTFLSAYPQNTNIGNFTANQTKNATWFISTPLTETNYTLNVTYTDYYSNTWNSSDFYVYVSSTIGGAGYYLSVSGYPEVETSNPYYAESTFTQNGLNANPDSIYISLYDSTGTLVAGPASMTQKSTGVYNYSYSVGASVNEGQWETRVNATKSSISYFANQFWKVVGGPFDVRSITIIDSSIPNLNISFIAENTGGANKDLILIWNLTREDTSAQLNSGSETFMVPASSEKTWYIYPSTDYTGQVRITLLGYYSGTEKAGAYKIFSTTPAGEVSCGDGTCNGGETCSTCPSDCGVCPPSGGGGGGGGGGATIVNETGESGIGIEKFDKTITMTKNIEKTSYFTIKNTGEIDLIGIALFIESLDSSYYTLSPQTISSLKPGKTADFKITFFITDFMGEKDFNYFVNSSQTSKKESGRLIVLSMKDYFTKIITNLKERASIIKEIGSEKIIEDLKECISLIENAEKAIENEEYINAKNQITEAEKCIDSLEEEMKKEPVLAPFIEKISANWIWIVTWVLISLLILVIVIALILMYKKLSLFGFIKTKSEEAMNKKNTRSDNLSQEIEKLEKQIRGEKEPLESKKLGKQIKGEKEPSNIGNEENSGK